jgi:hypothetical protein
MWGNEHSHPKWVGAGVPMDFPIFKEQFHGSNPIKLRIPYIIGKILERRCLKWARMTHLDTSNTSYGQKKGRESNCQFPEFLLLGNWEIRKLNPDFLACKWHATCYWKAIDNGYNFPSNLISIGGLHTKLWAPKIMGVPTLGISGLPLGSPGTKWHLGVGPMARPKLFYKGKDGGFPQVHAMLSLVNPCLPVAHLCTKST